jgi:hypothetical protein
MKDHGLIKVFLWNLSDGTEQMYADTQSVLAVTQLRFELFTPE